MKMKCLFYDMVAIYFLSLSVSPCFIFHIIFEWYNSGAPVWPIFRIVIFKFLSTFASLSCWERIELLSHPVILTTFHDTINEKKRRMKQVSSEHALAGYWMANSFFFFTLYVSLSRFCWCLCVFSFCFGRSLKYNEKKIISIANIFFSSTAHDVDRQIRHHYWRTFGFQFYFVARTYLKNWPHIAKSKILEAKNKHKLWTGLFSLDRCCCWFFLHFSAA